MRKLRPMHVELIRPLIAKAVRSSEELRYLYRMQCVLLVGEGQSCYQVAKWLSSDARTIERWVHAYEQRGAEGLRDHHGGGRPGRLSGQQIHQLKEDLGQVPRVLGYEHPKWDGKLLAAHLQARYGVRLGIRQCQRILRVAGRDVGAP
jgi:transposase